MGKGKRTRISSENEKIFQAERLVALKKEKKKSRFITAIVVTSIIALGLASVFASIGYNTLNKNGYFMRHTTAISTKDFDINSCMVQYLYNATIKNFAESNASNLSNLSLDTTKDLSLQTCAYDENISWHDYFLENTKAQYQEIIALAQAAKDEGMELSDSDYKYIDESMNMLDSLAEDDGLTTREYLDQNYGTQVALEDIRDCIEITQLASNYKTKYDDSLNYTDSEIEAYWTENKSSFFTCDYMSFTVNPTATGEESEEELKILQKAARKQAEELANADSYTKFKENLTAYFEKELKAADKSLSDEDLKTSIDTLISNSTVTAEGYDVSSDAGVWLFDKNRKPGDTTVIAEEDGGYTAYCMLTPATKDEAETKNVRHILLSLENYDDESDCKNEANRLLKEWRNGEKTEESFALLAKDYSDDPGSSQLGGLYENVTEGLMVEPFNDWIFATSRKTGDVDVVKTDYGFHVMYFVSDGYKAWQSDVVSSMKTDDYAEKLEKIKKEISPKTKDKAFKGIVQVGAEKE